MITSYRNGKATPHKLEIKNSTLDLSSNLIQLFENSKGLKRFEIEEEVKAYNVKQITPKVIQGMAKILFHRSTFSEYDDEDPQEIRQDVFTASAIYWRQLSETNVLFTEHKKKILGSINRDTPETINDTESWLFGDMVNNRKLESFEGITPEELIHRFNIEQVQGLLLYSQKLELTFSRQQNAAFRQMMQYLKFFQLMFDIKNMDENNVTLLIDGPSSVLENSRSYGLEIAQFFPAILLLTVPWRLIAELKVPGRHRRFKLEITDQNPYKTFYQEKGIWKRNKIQNLVDRFNQKYGEDCQANLLQDIITLQNNRYLIPDFNMQSSTKNSREIQIEWIQYVTKAKIKWLQQIRSELPDNYVFAIKGKRARLGKLMDCMGKNILMFSNELTAPALKKKMDEFDSE